jgi:hypothetical protein
MTFKRLTERNSEPEPEEYSYSGPAFNDDELVDLDELDYQLRDSLSKHELLAAGVDPKHVESLYPKVKPLTRTECDSTWTETYDNLTPQQLLLIEFKESWDAYMTEEQVRNAIPDVEAMTDDERREFFGGMHAAGLITITYKQQVDGTRKFLVSANRFPFATPKRKFGGDFGSKNT